MPANYVTMWGMLILMALGALCEVDFHGFSLRAAYPADLSSATRCIAAARWIRRSRAFSEGDRETCYRAVLPASARAAPKPGAGW